jgi:DNA (cytosine-5)-methyltransferase 1
LIVQPMAVRGRVGGSELELGHPDGPYNTLRAGNGGSSRSALVGISDDSGTTVRRLTPTECERLQGFPDDWTEGQSDSARYRQLGNAVAVPVAEWIAKRLVEANE